MSRPRARPGSHPSRTSNFSTGSREQCTPPSLGTLLPSDHPRLSQPTPICLPQTRFPLHLAPSLPTNHPSRTVAGVARPHTGSDRPHVQQTGDQTLARSPHTPQSLIGEPSVPPRSLPFLIPFGYGTAQEASTPASCSSRSSDRALSRMQSVDRYSPRDTTHSSRPRPSRPEDRRAASSTPSSGPPSRPPVLPSAAPNIERTVRHSSLSPPTAPVPLAPLGFIASAASDVEQRPLTPPPYLHSPPSRRGTGTRTHSHPAFQIPMTRPFIASPTPSSPKPSALRRVQASARRVWRRVRAALTVRAPRGNKKDAL